MPLEGLWTLLTLFSWIFLHLIVKLWEVMILLKSPKEIIIILVSGHMFNNHPRHFLYYMRHREWPCFSTKDSDRP